MSSSMLKDSTYAAFRSYEYNIETNLTKKEPLALNNLRYNKSTVNQKFYIGNSAVVFDKWKHLKGMFKILNNNIKFELLRLNHDKELDYISNLAKKLLTYWKIWTTNRRFKRLIRTIIFTPLALVLVYYMVWPKCINQWLIDPLFNPLLSAKDTPSCKLAKVFVPIVTPLTARRSIIFWFWVLDD